MCLILHVPSIPSHNSSLVYSYSNKYQRASIISQTLSIFVNSTSTLNYVTFLLPEPFARISSSSLLSIASCSFSYLSTNISSVFVSEGTIFFDNVKIVSEYTPSLVSTKSNSSLAESTVHLFRSQIENVIVDSCMMGIGRMKIQDVTLCIFLNVTYSGHRECQESMSEECIFDETEVEKSVEGIYGEFVSGIGMGTISSFHGFNCSLTSCFRTPPLFHRHRIDTNAETVTSSHYSYTDKGGTISSYDFQNCTANSGTDSSTSSCGGALCLYYNSSQGTYSVTIQNCYFTSCTATVDGGAVYCSYPYKFVVTNCSFIHALHNMEVVEFLSLIHQAVHLCQIASLLPAKVNGVQVYG